MHHYTFVKYLFNIFLSTSGVKKTRSLHLRYREKNLAFWDEKLEERKKYYGLDKDKSGGVIIENQFFEKILYNHRLAS